MYIEFCGGGAVDSIMLELEKPLTEPQIKYIGRQMVEGLEFLHQHFIIHRDIKAGNVLLTNDGQVKLGQFNVLLTNDGQVKLNKFNVYLALNEQVKLGQFNVSLTLNKQVKLGQFHVSLTH